MGFWAESGNDGNQSRCLIEEQDSDRDTKQMNYQLRIQVARVYS